MYKIIEALSVLYFMAMVVVVSIVVIGRYGFNSTPRWGEEIALFCMVWFSMLSASLAIFDDRHIRITIIEKFLSKKAAKALNLSVNIFTLMIIGFLVIKGFGLLEVTRDSLMGGSGISFMYLYAAVPISAICMFIATIAKVGEILGSRQ
jgi:TRAP-type C4-dicarboxylate transport system permease small subunit